MAAGEDVLSVQGFVREVGVTPAEFERGLRLALPGGVSSPQASVFVADDGRASLRLELSSLAERKLGLFRLPVTRVHLRFLEGEADARARLLARLDLAMQRGGG